MIIGEITIAPMHHRPYWDDPTCSDGYMPRTIPDWGSDIHISIQLSGMYEEWTQLLQVPIARYVSYLTQDIELTQQVIDRLAEMNVVQKRLEEVQRIFDECNEPEEICCAHP